MIFKYLLKKGFVISVVCILTLVYIPSINGASVENQKKEVLTDGRGTVKSGFIIGPYESKTMDGDMLVLIANWTNYMARRLTIIVPFMIHQINYLEQVKLVKFDKCIIMKNYIIGFCKIYLPQSKISMHVLSQNDQENQVTWIVDEINGDKVWERNIDIKLYTEYGNEYQGWITYGPRGTEYLNIGDQIQTTIGNDGFYKVKFIDTVTQDILFESLLVKF